MGTYIMLFGFTQQGIVNVKESPARIEAAKKTCEAVGVGVKDFYSVMGMGRYDTVFILEASDDETVAKAAFAIASQANVRTETHRAFTEDEFRKVIGALP